MSIFNKKFKKYNVTLKKLFDAILSLSHEQQTQVMVFVEQLLAENKRISVRKACDIPISYATQNRIYSDNITDISKSGLFIETMMPLNVGEEVVLSFSVCLQKVLDRSIREGFRSQIPSFSMLSNL